MYLGRINCSIGVSLLYHGAAGKLWSIGNNLVLASTEDGYAPGPNLTPAIPVSSLPKVTALSIRLLSCNSAATIGPCYSGVQSLLVTFHNSQNAGSTYGFMGSLGYGVYSHKPRRSFEQHGDTKWENFKRWMNAGWWYTKKEQ
jgi:hypothetical protein